MGVVGTGIKWHIPVYQLIYFSLYLELGGYVNRGE